MFIIAMLATAPRNTQLNALAPGHKDIVDFSSEVVACKHFIGVHRNSVAPLGV